MAGVNAARVQFEIMMQERYRVEVPVKSWPHVPNDAGRLLISACCRIAMQNYTPTGSVHTPYLPQPQASCRRAKAVMMPLEKAIRGWHKVSLMSTAAIDRFDTWLFFRFRASQIVSKSIRQTY